jgi:hypothetical protein
MLRSILFGFFMTLASLAGCAYPDDSDCDPGQVFLNGYCQAPPATDAAAGGATGAGGAAGAAGATSTEGVPEAFGVTCTDTADCAAPTDLCVKSPMDTEGYCSTADCITDEDCPEAYTCIDLGIPSVPTYCGR